MERLFVVRHGQRLDLVDDKWRTSAENPYDSPLSAHGVEQAEQLARFFRRETVPCSTTLLCSPYLRAMQTAQPTARALGVRVRIEPGIAESELRAIDKFSDGTAVLPFPHTVGTPDVAGLLGPEHVDESWAPLLPRPDAFEDTEACYARGQAFVDALERAEAAGRVSGTVLLFTHAAMAIAIVRAALADPAYDSLMPVCGVRLLRPARERTGRARWVLVRDADATMLDNGAEHAWNFAMRRCAVPGYTEPPKGG